MLHCQLHEAQLQNTTVIPVSRKAKLLGFDCKLCEYSITCADCIKYSAVLFDVKLHYQLHVDYIFSQTIRLLGFTWKVAFSCLQILIMLCCTSVSPKLGYASVVWNYTACTDASQLERV